jgi:hypothetical protein
MEKICGNFEKSLELNEKDLEIYLKCLGPSHCVSGAKAPNFIFENLFIQLQALNLQRIKAPHLCIDQDFHVSLQGPILHLLL